MNDDGMLRRYLTYRKRALAQELGEVNRLLAQLEAAPANGAKLAMQQPGAPVTSARSKRPTRALR